MSAEFEPPPESFNEDRGPGLRSFNAVWITFSVLAVSLRIYSRSLGPTGSRGHRRFWWDDWAALAALPFVATQQALTLATISLGVGRHIWTISPENGAKITEIIFAIYLNYDAGLFLAKQSALLFLTRVFPDHANPTWVNVTRYAAYGLNVAWLLGIVFGTFFICDPVKKNWQPAVEGECGSTNGLFLGSVVPSVFIDLLILVMPLLQIWKLRITRRRKVGITVIFFFGYGVVVVSLGRLVTVLRSGRSLDLDLTCVPVIYWVTAEPPITLLSVCLPAMLPLGKHLGTTYLSPLASKISVLSGSLVGSHRKIESRSGNFSLNEINQDNHYFTHQESETDHDAKAVRRMG